MKSAIVIILIVIIGGWFLLSRTPASTPPSETTNQTSVVTTTTSTTTTTTTGMTVTYGAQGFSPASLTVPVGTTVTFVNQAGNEMWIASDSHPTHQGYDGTTKSQHCVAGYTGAIPFDQCTAGASYSFTFLKEGTWRYHNHSSAGDTGTVIVTAAAALIQN